MPNPSLIFLAGPNAGRRYKLLDGHYIIGRRSDCQIFVPDMRVSRQHARIFRDSGKWMIEDLGSNNGTFVNGETIQTVALSDEDEITIAQNRVRVDMPKSTKGDFDSNVTIVDVDNPALYMSSAQPDASRKNAWHRLPLPGADPENPRLLLRKLHALQSILEIAASVAEPEQLMESVVGQLLEVFPRAHSVGVLVENERTQKLEVRCHRKRQTKRRTFGDEMRVPGTIIDIVVRDQRGVLMSDAERASKPLLAGTKPAKEPNGSRMGAPLQARDTHYGVMYVECGDQSFRQEDLDLLTSIAAQTGLAIHAARMHGRLQQRDRLERDLRMARQIQRSLMRDPPEVHGLEFAVHYEPAYQIGGDFYDFIWHDNEHLGLMVGDVSGKAISAALYMARLTSEIRGRVGIAQTPERLLERVNREMVKLGDDGMFATLVYAVYHLETRILAYTNAGHCTPLLRRGDKVFPIHTDRAHIPPIGILPDIDIGEARVQLYQQDLVVFVSDGILEAHSPDGEEYGVPRLSQCLQQLGSDASTEEVIKSILESVDRHVATGSQGDDMTVLAMRIASGRARRQPTTVAGVGIPANVWDGHG